MNYFYFYGVRFSAVNLSGVLEYLHAYDYTQPGYVSFPDSSVVALAYKDEELRGILNQAFLTLPDGKPSQVAARRQGYQDVSTVSGYWLCRQLLNDDRLSHYFLGSTPDKLDRIRERIEREYPSARVLGYRSPDFITAEAFRNGHLLDEELREINSLRPDLIWVGLSSPKQDFMIRSHVKKLNRGIFLGVGGVFDYLSGDIAKSPEWVKKIGLRWLWRLLSEPKRLGPKYWNTIKFFVKNPYRERVDKKYERAG